MKSKKRMKLYNIFILIMIILGLLIPVISSVYVSAQEEEDTEQVEYETEDGEEDEDSKEDKKDKDVLERKMSGNVYSEGNATAVGALEQTVQYNIGMHYLITYNVLKSELGTGRGESNYNKIYYGQDGGAFDGIALTIKEGVANFNHEPIKVLKGLSEDKVSDDEEDEEDTPRTDDGGGDAVGDSDPIGLSDEEQVTKEELMQQEEQLRHEAALEIVAALMPKFQQYYGLNKNELEMVSKDKYWTVVEVTDDNLDWYNLIDVGKLLYEDAVDLFNFGAPDAETRSNNRMTRVAMVDGLSMYKANQSAISQGTGGISEYNKQFREGLVKVVERELGKGKLLGGTLRDQDIDRILQSAEEEYKVLYKNQYDMSHTGMRNFFEGTLETMTGSEKVTSESHSPNVNMGMYMPTMGPVYVFKVNSNLAKDNNEAFGVVKNRGLNYLGSLFYTVKSKIVRSSEQDKMALKEINDRMVEASNQGKYKELLDFVKENGVDNAGGNVLISWTPFFMEITSTELKNFNEYMKKSSDGKYEVSNNTFKSEKGNLRPALGMDLFMSNKKGSPVLYGLNGTGVVALHLGHEGGIIQSYANKTHEMIGAQGKVDNLKFLTDLEVTDINNLFEGRTKGLQLISLATGIYNVYGSGFKSENVSADAVIGMDSYGNIINGASGDVYVPYWQVDFMLEGDAESPLSKTFYQFAPSITGAKSDYFDIAGSVTDKGVFYKVSSKKSTAEIAKMLNIQDTELRNAVNEINKQLHKNLTYEDAKRYVKEGIDGYNKEVTLQALAAIITANTSEYVQAYNQTMLQDAKDGRYLFILTDNDLDDLTDDDDGVNAFGDLRWTAASIIQKLGQIFDYGFSETIRNSVATTLGKIYNTDIADSSLSKVFYTDTVATSSQWTSALLVVTTVLGFVGGLYLIILGFKSFRGGNFDIRRVLLKFITLAIVIVYPIYIYGPIVNLVMNKPTDYILGQHMKISSILDTYMLRENKEQEISEYYTNTFGQAAAEGEVQMGTYILNFYTTMDKEGFDINEEDIDNPRLSQMAKVRLESYREQGADYPKENLEVIRVPLIDLYAWVWDVSYGGDATLDTREDVVVDGDTTGTDGEINDGTEKMLTYEEGVESGQVKPLFEWLADGGSSRFPVSGYQTEIRDFHEYGFNQYQRILGKNKYETSPDNNIGKFYETMAKIPNGYVTGSQLFYEVVYAASQEGVNYNLSRLHALSSLYNNNLPKDPSIYVMTERNKRSLIRDLSSTAKTREIWYGERKWSNFTKNMFKGASGEITTTDEETKRLPILPELDEPKEDFLGLTSLIDNMTKKREDLRAAYYRTLGTMVFDVNKGVLEKYMGTYSITRDSLTNVRNEDTLAHSEKMIVATEAYFNLNKTLSFNNFPQGYRSNTLSFDKYLSLLYIPFRDYGRDVLTFIDDETATPRSTAEYIAFKENGWGMTMFALTVIALIIFGIIYTAIFYVGLMIISVYNFIKYYIIKADYQNKSWLGLIYIILSLGLVKYILMIVWSLATFMMNKSIAMSEIGKPSYPTTIIHSLAVIGIIVIGIWFVIRRTLMNVLSDKENLGGQRFIDGAGNTFNKMTNGTFKGRGGTGFNGKSSASQFKEDLAGGKGLDMDSKKRANRIGKLDEDGISRAKENASKTNKGIGNSILTSRARENKLINSIKNGLNRKRLRADMISGSTSNSRRLIDGSKLLAANRLSSNVYGDLADDINAMGATILGVNKDEYVAASNGALLSTNVKDKMTTVQLRSVGSAKVLEKGLRDRGINAIRKGKSVIFESGGYDLTNAEVRNELFVNPLAELIDAHSGNRLDVVKGTLKSGYKTDMYRMKDSQTISAYFGEEGLSSTAYEDLFNTEDFKNSFIKPDISRYIDSRGNIVGWVPLKLKNPSLSENDKRKRAARLFSKDESIRKMNKLASRNENNLTGVYSLRGSQESIVRLKENGILAKVLEPGMLIQGNDIRYDKTNKAHMSALAKLDMEIARYNKGVDEEYGKDAQHMAVYIAKNGDNRGLRVTTESADRDPIKSALLYKTGATNKTERQFKVSKENHLDTFSKVNKLKSIKEDINGEHGENVIDFAKRKMELISEFKKNKLNNKGKSIELSGDIESFIKKEPKANSAEVKRLMKDLRHIESQERLNEITKDKANELRTHINKDLISVMERYGYLDSYITTKHSDLSGVQNYEESLNKLEQQGAKTSRRDYMNVPIRTIMSMANKTETDDTFDFKDGILSHTVRGDRKGAIDIKDKDDVVLSYLTNKPLEYRNIKSRQLD